MLSYIWGGFIIIGVTFGALKGVNITEEILQSGKDAISLAITMFGIIPLWTGLINIGKNSGLISFLSKKINPIIDFLFPSIPKEHKSRDYIATNLIANFLGLGFAATPAGLSAMKELDKLNKKKGTATKAMCMFMIVNMSSVQLVSINIIAYRSQYNSASPSEIIISCIVATFFSTLVGVVFAKLMEKYFYS